WNALVGVWWKMESGTRFVSPTKGLPTTHRPGQIHTWIKCARKGTPKLGPVQVLAANVQQWWASINPEWRTKAEGFEFTKEEGGSLESLRCPGANGFLSVLIALKWWGEQKNDDEWKSAVTDVTWVIERL
ncbi:hypothetical protein C8R43DRAFT_850120, partial [Mycena crocata]